MKKPAPSSSAMSAPESDLSGTTIETGMRVLAFARRFERRQISYDIFEQGMEMANSDIVDHSGIVDYHNFGFHVKFDRADKDGIISRRMDGESYIYQII